jgi:hypothetical protein
MQLAALLGWCGIIRVTSSDVDNLVYVLCLVRCGTIGVTSSAVNQLLSVLLVLCFVLLLTPRTGGLGHGLLGLLDFLGLDG